MSKNNNKVLILSVRLGVLAILITLVVVAVLDFKTKGNAENTAKAWRELINDHGVKPTTMEELEERKAGSPAESEGKRAGNYDVKIYTWKRKFPFLEDFAIHVEYSKKTMLVNAVEAQWGKEE